MKKLIVLLFAAACHGQEPLRCSVNLRGSMDPANLLGLHPSHIGKGWPQTTVIDARCSGPDQLGCWVRLNALAAEPRGRYISYRIEPAADLPLQALGAMPPGMPSVTYLGRTYPDIRRLDTRHEFATLMLAELARYPSPIVFHDNIVHPSADKAWPFTWEQTCGYLNLLRVEGRAVIPNIAGSSWHWSWADRLALQDSVDGMAFEIGVHPSIRANGVDVRRQADVYRTWLAAGKIVVLMWINRALITEAERDEEARYTAAFAMLVREPEQKLWVHWPYWKPAPDWQDWPNWPQKLGAPITAMEIDSDGSAWRAFEGGVLRISAPRGVSVVWGETGSVPE